MSRTQQSHCLGCTKRLAQFEVRHGQEKLHFRRFTLVLPLDCFHKTLDGFEIAAGSVIDRGRNPEVPEIFIFQTILQRMIKMKKSAEPIFFLFCLASLI